MLCKLTLRQFFKFIFEDGNKKKSSIYKKKKNISISKKKKKQSMINYLNTMSEKLNNVDNYGISISPELNFKQMKPNFSLSEPKKKIINEENDNDIYLELSKEFNKEDYKSQNISFDRQSRISNENLNNQFFKSKAKEIQEILNDDIQSMAKLETSIKD